MKPYLIMLAACMLATIGYADAAKPEQQFLYTGDFHTGYVYKINLADGTATIFLGKQIRGGGLDFDSHGNLFITGGREIDKVTPDGKVIPFVTGLKNGFGLAVDVNDDVYCTEYLSKVGKVYRFHQPKNDADLPIAISYLDDAGKDYRITPDGSGTAIDDGLTWPYGMSSDMYRNVYINVLGNRVYQYTPDGKKLDLGQGAGWGRTAVVDAQGDLYGVGFNIIKVSHGQALGMVAPGADFNHSVGLALDAMGNLYQTNCGENHDGVVFKYAPDGRRSVFARNLGNQPFWLTLWPKVAPPKRPSHTKLSSEANR